MKASDFVTTSEQKVAASERLLFTEQTDAVNTGIVDSADKKGVSERSESTFYANMNPNGAGKLKMEEFMGVMEVTGDLRALRCLAAFFGQSLVPLEAAEPDAPTVEAEMLQDYPAVVEFHAAAKRYQEGKETSVEVLTRLEAAVLDLRQTASMTLEHGKK